MNWWLKDALLDLHDSKFNSGVTRSQRSSFCLKIVKTSKYVWKQCPTSLWYGWVGGTQVSLFCTSVRLLGILCIQYIQQYCISVGKHHCTDYQSKTCLSYSFQSWDSELYLIPGSEGLKCSGYNRDSVPLGNLKTVTGPLMFRKREHPVVGWEQGFLPYLNVN